MAEGFVLNIKSHAADLQRRLMIMERDMPFVTAYALTKTAQDAKTEEIAVMGRVFDRPTRFTLNALYVRPATKQNLTAVVEFKEGFGSIPAWRYLGPQVMGGGRKHKSHEKRLISAGLMMATEYAVPGKGVPLDQYGNVRGSEFNKLLSDLGARADPYDNSTAKSRKRRKWSGRYLVLRNVSGAPNGVYLRKGTGIVPILIFVRAPHYTKRFPFYETAERVMQMNFARHFRDGWQRYVVGRAGSPARVA